MLKEEDVWQILNKIMDPEIPVVSIVEMGIVRNVDLTGDTVRVLMTPTFTGCPALEIMQAQAEASLRLAGLHPEIVWSSAPAWSSDWIAPEARKKMALIGLAAPPHHSGFIELALQEQVRCPFCDSVKTTQKNSFGPSLCRSIYFCSNCQQPFERFKPL
jgi:ring-1,2-phenylacetyl-CoA epoxidase subunit PaaD